MEPRFCPSCINNIKIINIMSIMLIILMKVILFYCLIGCAVKIPCQNIRNISNMLSFVQKADSSEDLYY